MFSKNEYLEFVAASSVIISASYVLAQYLILINT